MSDRLTHKELEQVILEMEKMRSLTEDELTREQVEEILQELNLSPDLLDDALIQLRRKQALKARQRRNIWLGLGAVASLLIVINVSVFFSQKHNTAIARVQAIDNRITLEQDKEHNFKVIERQYSPQVVYRVTLKDAPIGKRLDLLCNWVNPNGDVVQQNRYQTRKITTSVWNTRCRYIFVTSSPVGNWQVQMFLGERQLSTTNFEVK